jgi:hypothetical protein
MRTGGQEVRRLADLLDENRRSGGFFMKKNS